MGQTSLLEINPGLVVWTLVTFVALLLILKKFVWGPILAAVDRREESLKQMFESAEKAKLQAQQLLESYEKQLAAAREEVEKIIENGKIRAGKAADEIIAQAHEESRELVERAKAEIIRERDEAAAQIRNEVVRISLEAAERLIMKSLEEADHRRFIEQTIADIETRVK